MAPTSITYMASKSYKTPLHYVTENGHLEIVEFLLKADANAPLEGDEFEYDEEEPRKTELEFQPIHIATQRGYFEIVKLLIEKGSDIDNSVTSKTGRFRGFRGQLCITRFFTR